MLKLSSVQDVSEWGLCIGCGACAYVCPENVTLSNVIREGIRPRVERSHCGECEACLQVCPGINAEHSTTADSNNVDGKLMTGWGPILEIWEGHAADSEVRFNGSSGGLSSALALYCIEKGGMHGLLHIGPDDEKPLSNKTYLSTSRNEIVARTGSRYAPASPCDGLAKIAAAPDPCVFIGKPCDVTAVSMARSLKGELDEKIGVTIGFFCAGTPSTQGTLDLIKTLGVAPDTVEEVRYRGRGWPGKFSVKIKGEERPREAMTYMDSWSFLQKYRPYRCHLCPDGTGEFADLSCGDPWYRNIEEGEPGHSIVLVRTERGREVLRGAIEAGYVKLSRADSSILENSQPNLAMKRRAIWGRIFAMRLFGIPTPKFRGFSLFENWKRLSLEDKARSILGTARRVMQRGYYRRRKPLPSDDERTRNLGTSSLSRTGKGR
jgi:coenzyme F420 hydrogenase subunit beta